MSMAKVREQRVPWPIPSRDGLHFECPLCGMSENRFDGSSEWRQIRLQEHILAPHARCKPCGKIVGAHRMRYHRERWHRYPTMVLPGLEYVA